MKKVFRPIYYKIIPILSAPKYLYGWLIGLCYRLKVFSLYEIPVIINNFNRLEYLVRLIGRLKQCGFTNIIILDNDSTFPPLIEYYKRCDCKILRQNSNLGHLALWKSIYYNKYKWNYFIYTDPDLLPIEECPEDFIEYFHSILYKNFKLDKIGFGIKIDDLPDSFSLKKEVINYESRYWSKEVMPNIYDAPIDTTFALYKPLSSLKAGQVHTFPAFRTGFPYLINHLPWYVDSKNLTDEELYYRRTCNESSSIVQQEIGRKKIY